MKDALTQLKKDKIQLDKSAATLHKVLNVKGAPNPNDI